MSADELDAELLAMAGSDSSDDEGDIEQTQVINDRSPSPEAPVKASVEQRDDSGPRRGVAQRIKPRRGKKVVRRRESSDEEDGEASAASSPRSLGSGAMDQSDSEAGAPASPTDDDDAPLYPVEGKFTSSSDRARILGLPEIEREEILAERAANVLRRQQDLQLKRVLAATREKAKSHKRKAAAADLDDETARKSSRPKVEKVGRSALDDYKLAREQRGADKSTRLDPRRGNRDERSPSSASDRDADGESEVEWAEPEARPKRDDPPADIKDFNRAQVGRSNFAKVCFYPNFETCIKGCYARVSIGPDRQTGQNMYRMAQIRGFTEGKPYQLTGSNNKTFTTDQYALVAHGSSEKPWPFLACSDSKFTDAEVDRYLATLKKDNIRTPARSQINRKLDDITSLLNHTWTDTDIQAKINKQRAIEKKYDPANAANLAREKIAKRRTRAEDQGDVDEIARCDAELAALENQQANGTSIKPKPSTFSSGPAKQQKKLEQDRLAELNQQTRRINAEEVRKALVEERRKRDRAREKALAEHKAKAAAEEQAKLKVPGMADLFGESDISRTGTPVNGTPKRSRAGTPATGSQGKVKGPLGAVRGRGKMEDEVIGGMDLGIDIEI